MFAWLTLALAASAAPADAPVVLVDGTATSAGITWETTVLTADPPDTYALAAPLPPGTEVVLPALALRDAGGAVTGIALPAPGRSFTVQQPFSAPDAVSALAAPLVVGARLERITLDGLRWTPDPALGLDHQLRGWADPAIDAKTRRALDKTAGRAHAADQPIWVLPEGAVAARGLAGALTPPHPTAATAGIAATVFAGVVALFALVAKRLDLWARAEANAVYIDRELAASEPVNARSRPT